MGKVVRPAFSGQEWTASERRILTKILATLDRIVGLTACEHGITDEREPWCVYYDIHTDELIVQVLRIAGRYLIVGFDGTKATVVDPDGIVPIIDRIVGSSKRVAFRGR